MGSQKDAIREFVARENLRRFRDKLASLTDESRRAVLRGLLKTEEHALSDLNGDNDAGAPR